MARTEGVRPQTRRAEVAAQTRKRILSVALDQFTRSTYADVTVADIAASAGVAKGLVFHHFGSKEGLFLEALRVASAELDASHHSDPQVASGERIAQRFHGHLAYLADHKDLALNLILRSGDAGPEVAEAFESLRWSGIEWICRLLGLDPERESLSMAMRTYVIAADNITTRWLQQDVPFDIDAMTQALLEMLIGALKAAARIDSYLHLEDAIATIEARQLTAPKPRRRTAATRSRIRASR